MAKKLRKQRQKTATKIRRTSSERPIPGYKSGANGELELTGLSSRQKTSLGKRYYKSRSDAKKSKYRSLSAAVTSYAGSEAAQADADYRARKAEADAAVKVAQANANRTYTETKISEIKGEHTNDGANALVDGGATTTEITEVGPGGVMSDPSEESKQRPATDGWAMKLD